MFLLSHLSTEGYFSYGLSQRGIHTHCGDELIIFPLLRLFKFLVLFQEIKFESVPWMEVHAFQLDLGLTRENVQFNTKLGPNSVSEPHKENNTSLLS